MKRKKRIIVGVSVALLAGVIYLGTILVGAVGSLQGGSQRSDLRQVWAGIANPRSLFPNQSSLTIMLVGQDYNRDRKGMPYTKASRADTIMILSANLESKTVRACSIPRDTLVEAADGVRGKINATLARGGVELLTETLQNRFAITIDHHVIIKPDAVRTIVDSVGGVEVETIDAMKYTDNWGGLNIDLPEGRQFINGEQAEGFVRFREVNRMRMTSSGRMVPIRGVKSSKEEGDLRRTARQQQLIQSLIRAVNRPNNLVRLGEIIEAGFGEIDTDLSRTQILALGTIFRGSSQQTMVSATLPGTDSTESGAYFYVLDDERAQATIDWILKGDPLAMRRLMRVEVRNGTETRGLAREVADQLKDAGFTATAPGSADPVETTIIEYRRAAFLEPAEDIARILGFGQLRKAESGGNDWNPEIRIVIGADRVPRPEP